MATFSQNISIFAQVFLCESFARTQRIQDKPANIYIYMFIYFLSFSYVASCIDLTFAGKAEQIKSRYFLSLHLYARGLWLFAGDLGYLGDLQIETEGILFFLLQESLARDVCLLMGILAAN